MTEKTTEREAFVKSQCGDDPGLVEEVVELLRAAARDSSLSAALESGPLRAPAALAIGALSLCYAVVLTVLSIRVSMAMPFPG